MKYLIGCIEILLSIFSVSNVHVGYCSEKKINVILSWFTLCCYSAAVTPFLFAFFASTYLTCLLPTINL